MPSTSMTGKPLPGSGRVAVIASPIVAPARSRLIIPWRSSMRSPLPIAAFETSPPSCFLSRASTSSDAPAPSSG